MIFKHGVSVLACLVKAGTWFLVSELERAGRAVMVCVVLERSSFISFSFKPRNFSFTSEFRDPATFVDILKLWR